MVVREEIPLAYLPGGVTRVRVRVLGDLSNDITRLKDTCLPAAALDEEAPAEEAGRREEAAESALLSGDAGVPGVQTDPAQWQPEVFGSSLASRVGTGVLLDSDLGFRQEKMYGEKPGVCSGTLVLQCFCRLPNFSSELCS